MAPHKSNPLRRRRPSRKTKPRFLIVCEGSLTEPSYFNDLRIGERALIVLEIEPAGVPKAVVERALELRSEAEQKARRAKDQFLRFEEVWCVFDVDEHPWIEEAWQQARDNHLNVAISNPCFELWALLHFQDQNADIHRHRVQELCRNHMPGFEKQLDYKRLDKRYQEALRRAQYLDHIHALNNRPGANPSTGVHHLVAAIKQRGSLPG